MIQVSTEDFVPQVGHEAYLVPTVAEDSIASCALTDCCVDSSSILDVLRGDRGFQHNIQPHQEIYWNKQGFERKRMLVRKLTSCYCALRVRMPSRFPARRKTMKANEPIGLDTHSTRILQITGYSLADMINDIARVPLRACVRRDDAETTLRTKGARFFEDLISSIEEDREMTEDDVVEMIDRLLKSTREEIKRENARLTANRRNPKNNFRARNIALSASEEIARGMKFMGKPDEIVTHIAHSIRSNPITMGFRASPSMLSNWEKKRESKQYWQVHDFMHEKQESYTSLRDDTERYFFGYESMNGESPTSRCSDISEPFPNSIYERPISASVSMMSVDATSLVRDAAGGHFGSSFLVLKRDRIESRSTLIGTDAVQKFDALFEGKSKHQGCVGMSKFPPRRGSKEIGTFDYIWPAIMSMDRDYIKNVFLKRDLRRLFDSYLEINFVGLKHEQDVESYHLPYHDLSDGLTLVSELKDILSRWKALAGAIPVFITLPGGRFRGEIVKSVDDFLTALETVDEESENLSDISIIEILE